jgi:hypothetical protein
VGELGDMKWAPSSMEYSRVFALCWGLNGQLLGCHSTDHLRGASWEISVTGPAMGVAVSSVQGSSRVGRQHDSHTELAYWQALADTQREFQSTRQFIRNSSCEGTLGDSGSSRRRSRVVRRRDEAMESPRSALSKN